MYTSKKFRNGGNFFAKNHVLKSAFSVFTAIGISLYFFKYQKERATYNKISTHITKV